jgi:hypothetical protein
VIKPKKLIKTLKNMKNLLAKKQRKKNADLFIYGVKK